MSEYPGSYNHVAVRLNNYILVIGGMDMNDEPVSTHVIWMYNVYTDQWRKHQIPGQKNAPPQITSACAAAIGTDIYIFGGYDKMKRVTNELWKLTKLPRGCFDWNKVELQQDVKLPSPRRDHSGWKYEECLWVFGGFGPFSCKYLNDHGAFSYQQNNQLLCYSPSTQIWKNLECFGAVPSPRRGHSTDIIRDKVWLFSGLYSSNMPVVDLDDFFQLDMHSCTWTQITTGQTKPQKRFASSLCAVTENQLVLHGGSQLTARVNGSKLNIMRHHLNDTWIMDLSSQTWRQYASNQDHNREDHTCSLSAGKSIIIIGGDSTKSKNTDQILTYTPTFKLMLEPKSLQWLAMKTIYTNQSVLPWKCLPSRLVAQLDFEQQRNDCERHL